jgi:hypothetical protein
MQEPETAPRIRKSPAGCAVAVTLILIIAGTTGNKLRAQARRFNVRDDIGMTVLEDPYTGHSDPIAFSPDRRFFVVIANRGRLDLNRCESILRIYRSRDVHEFLLHPADPQPPAPVWVVSRATSKYGPVITDVRWLRDSSGLGFLAKTPSERKQLFLAEIATKTVSALTSDEQHVTGFDIRDRRHFVYSILRPATVKKVFEGANRSPRDEAASTVITGRTLRELFMAESPSSEDSIAMHDGSELWAVVGDRRFRVTDKSSGRPLSLYWEGEQALALAPDGHSVATSLAVATIPSDWEKRYEPPPGLDSSFPYRIKAGQQDVEAMDGLGYVSEYAVIDLLRGEVKRLVGAPTGPVGGWWGYVHAAWSADGKSIALTDTFLPAGAQRSEQELNRPCVAVVVLVDRKASCVAPLKATTKEGVEDGYRYITDVEFAGSNDRVTVKSFSRPVVVWGATTYVRSTHGTWAPEPEDTVGDPPQLDVVIKQSLNDPPVLMATDRESKVSRAIWEPNPDLKNVDWGEASVFKWTDKANREWVGGLYKPPGFVSGRRYPLVIQTHGFVQDKFNPSGLYTTAYAARELAAIGIVVVQVPDCSIIFTPEEAPCNVDGFEAAAERLVADGMVDRENIGLLGFSQSGYHVMQALVFGSLRYKAASLNDFTSEGYWDHLSGVDDNITAKTEESWIGARPFGDGLATWLKRSPGFNLDKINSAVLLRQNGGILSNAVAVWGTYAPLRYLKKPVDFVIINDEEHELTNPACRLASQGGTVDWFDFWLNGHEDPDPAKAEQYKRWRGLRELREKDQIHAANP